jgi:UDP-glucose 4-epimerase
MAQFPLTDIEVSESPINHLLITGTSGYVGKSFLKYIANQKQENLPIAISLVQNRTPIDVPEPLKQKTRIAIIEADLSAPWTFRGEFSHVLNLAADGSSSAYSKSSNELYEEINQNFARWIEIMQPQKILHVSSGACFGYHSLENTNNQESESYNSTRVNFAKSRLNAENFLKEAAERNCINFTIARLFTFIGEEILAKQQYAVSSFLNSATRGESIRLTGNPNTIRSYLSEYDLGSWLFKAINSVSNELPILEIGSERQVTLLDIANYISEKSKVAIIIENPNAHGDIYVANSKQTKEILNVTESSTWEYEIDKIFLK